MKESATLILFLFLAISFGFAQVRTTYANHEALEDLEYLYATLQDAHYNLFVYTPKETYDSVYTHVSSLLTADSISDLECVNAYQQLVSAANNGHTEIPFPGQEYGTYAYSGGTVFPLEVAFEEGKTLIRKNWSDKTNIEIGSELISLNGKSIEEILTLISPHISAEREYFKRAKIELYSLPRLYWQVFGPVDAFEVMIRQNGKIETFQLAAVPVIDGFEMKREELINAKLQLSFYGPHAYLNPGSFGGDLNAYKRFIDSSFTVIKEKESPNLIIDLRNNGGGDNVHSDYLISYFANKPFTWVSDFRLKSSALLKAHVRETYDTTSALWQSVLRHADGERFSFAFDLIEPQPKEKRFTGSVYVLVNRQSHSQSTVAAAQIQDNGFGTIVGEETGEYPTLYASIFRYPLPKTGIEVQVSKGYIIRVNGSTKEEGVIPDILIKDHLLDETDEILEGLLEQLNDQ